MANVGTVQSVTGLVRAIAEDGSERLLSIGDTVAENEKIITGDGVIVIAFNDGTVMDLGSNSSIVLNEDVLNQEGEQIAQNRADANDEVAALQEALVNPSFDPTAELPATAAGPIAAGGTDGNNGHTIVSVDYLNPDASVESGFDTIGISQEFLQPGEELPPVIENDGPEVSAADTAGGVTEAVDLSANEMANVEHEETGTITFDDVDLTDAHTVSVTSSTTGFLGSFVPTITDVATGAGDGTVSWVYHVNDAEIDDLAEGQEVEQVYTVEIADGNGGTVSRDIAITLTGTNDAPIISNAETAGSITEIADGGVGAGTADLTTDGTMDFNDVDLTDVHEVTFVPQADGYLGTFTAVESPETTGSTTSGGIAWDFTVNDSAVGYLAAGDRVVQSYDVTVTDSAGATATETVTITLNGTNDGPTVELNNLVSLDDDALSGGNPGGVGDDPDSVNATGRLSYSYGADGEGTVLLLGTGAPAGFVYSLNGDSTVLTVSQNGVDVLSVTLDDTTSGDYTVSQLAAIDHSLNNDEDNQDFRVNYQVTDSDVDTVDGSIDISVDDDTPLIVKSDSIATASEFTIVNHDEVSSAGYHNSYGYYVKTLNADGAVLSDDPTVGVIIENDVHFSDGGFTGPLTVVGYSQEQIGYFLIPNGDGRNPGLLDGQEVTFSKVWGNWQAFADGAPLVGNGSNVLFDLAELNNNGQGHMQDNDLTGNQNWEDMSIPGGDNDYNDVNVNVDWTKVTVTGEVVESVSFGADGLEGIDFTFDSSDIDANGTVTSNGDAIIFEAKDTDSDGVNDQIVGVAGGQDVLTIDGVLDGEYDVSILGPIDDGALDVDVGINVNVAATDGDGDVLSSVLNININFDLNQVLTDPVPNP